MARYQIDNLEEWTVVLEQLAAIKEKKELDQYQDVLERLLRFNDNWRLRETAIELSVHVENPNEKLIKELSHLVNDYNLYIDARVLALDALVKLIQKKRNSSKSHSFCSETVKEMEGLVQSPQPPLLYETLLQAIRTLQ